MTADVEIAEAAARDAPGIYAVNAAAFAQEDEARLVVELEREGALVLSLVARLENRVVGSVVFSRIRLEAEGGARPAVALAPLAVEPALQRRGIGARLVREGLARLAAAGEQVVVVLGDPSYYGRFGFSTELAAAIETPWSGPYLQALALGGSPAPGRCRAVYAAAFGAL